MVEEDRKQFRQINHGGFDFPADSNTDAPGPRRILQHTCAQQSC
jgi:hypothetical protein